jgi:CubicO group peptidase (beta-lactamase class C family)
VGTIRREEKLMSTRRILFSIFSILFLLAIGGVAGWAAGTGLTGEYYDNKDLTSLKLTRVDPSVNFDWGLNSPDPSIANDTFSVRWTGQVEALFSQTYKFYARTDDGVRLWVNGQLIIDKWIDQKAENSGSIALVAGQKYDLKMEYYENGSGAIAQLSWSSSSQLKQIIPQSQLYPASGGTPPPPPPPSGSGVTYYVAKTGKDTNACTSTAPCLTIQKGVSKAIAPGDTLIVMAGTYVEFVGTWFSGSSGKPIVVKANPGDTVIWRGPSQDKNSIDGAVTIQNASFIRIEGFRFEGSITRTTLRVRNTSASKTNPVQGIEIINNTFVNNGNNNIAAHSASTPVSIQQSGHSTFDAGDVVNTVSGNVFDGNYGYNISLRGSNDTIVSNNICRNVRSSLEPIVKVFIARFIQLGGGATRNIVENNTVSNFTPDSYVGSSKYTATGVKFDASASRNTVRRNVIHDIALNANGAIAGIETESGCNNNQIYENIVYRVKIGLRNGSFSTNVSAGNVWKNNVAYGCLCGLSLSKSQNVVVKNNIFSNNSNAQIVVSSEAVASGGNVFSNNDYFKAGTATIGVWNSSVSSCPLANKTLTQWSSSSTDKNSLSVDPKFVNPSSDFHLQSGSPVKDKGEGGVDMGAYPGNPGAGLTLSQQGPVVLDPSPTTSTSQPSGGQFVWRTASPESQQIDRSRLEVMVDVLAAHNTQAFLLIRNDHIVAEWYVPGRDPAKLHPVASLAKGLVGGMSLLVAINDGRLSLNDWAWKYIPAWRHDPQKSQIRIWHLAAHTSGLEDAQGPEPWKAAFWKRVPDPFWIAIEQAPLVFAPGTDFAYSNAGMAALAYAVTASLKRAGVPQSDIRSLLQQRIMQPLDISETEWSIGYRQPSQLDGLKLYANWGGAAYSPRAIAKVGRLMLRQGNWQGQQLVASSWVNKMISPPDRRFDSALCWLTNASGRWSFLPRDAFAAAGSGHEVLLVVPSLNLIVVRLGTQLADQNDFWAGIEEFLFDPLIKALSTAPER